MGNLLQLKVRRRPVQVPVPLEAPEAEVSFIEK
jgi:hypothetical protein